MLTKEEFEKLEKIGYLIVSKEPFRAERLSQFAGGIHILDDEESAKLELKMVKASEDINKLIKEGKLCLD